MLSFLCISVLLPSLPGRIFSPSLPLALLLFLSGLSASLPLFTFSSSPRSNGEARVCVVPREKTREEKKWAELSTLLRGRRQMAIQKFKERRQRAKKAANERLSVF